MNGLPGEIDPLHMGANDLQDPDFIDQRSKSGMQLPHTSRNESPDYNGFFNLRSSSSDWKLPQIGSTKNYLMDLPFCIKLIPCDLIESSEEEAEAGQEDERQSYDVFKTQSVDRAFNMSETLDLPKQEEILQAGPCPEVDDDVDLLELSDDGPRDNPEVGMFTFENMNKSNLDDGPSVQGMFSEEYAHKDAEQSRLTWMEINSDGQGLTLLNVVKRGGRHVPNLLIDNQNLQSKYQSNPSQSKPVADENTVKLNGKNPQTPRKAQKKSGQPSTCTAQGPELDDLTISGQTIEHTK